MDFFETVHGETFTSKLLAKQKFITQRRGSKYSTQQVVNFHSSKITTDQKYSGRQFAGYYSSVDVVQEAMRIQSQTALVVNY